MALFTPRVELALLTKQQVEQEKIVHIRREKNEE